MTPETKTVKFCKEQFWLPDIVTYRLRWNRYVTRDLYGFIDVVVLQPGQTGLLGIQATDLTNMSHRKRKILDTDAALLWLECGNRIEVWGWGQHSGPKRHIITPADFVRNP